MSTMLQEGIQLLMLGMGTVFVFLVVLIFGTSLMSSLVGRLNVSTATPGANSARPRTRNGQNSDPADTAAVVAAAAYNRHQRSR